jgi:hypothetical protein
MRWTRTARGKHRRDAPPEAQQSSPAVTRTPETERALAAARRAAADLDHARFVRRKLDRLGDEIDAETSKNGFRLIIESALGGRA